MLDSARADGVIHLMLCPRSLRGGRPQRSGRTRAQLPPVSGGARAVGARGPGETRNDVVQYRPTSQLWDVLKAIPCEPPPRVVRNPCLVVACECQGRAPTSAAVEDKPQGTVTSGGWVGTAPGRKVMAPRHSITGPAPGFPPSRPVSVIVPSMVSVTLQAEGEGGCC